MNRKEWHAQCDEFLEVYYELLKERVKEGKGWYINEDELESYMRYEFPECSHWSKNEICRRMVDRCGLCMCDDNGGVIIGDGCELIHVLHQAHNLYTSSINYLSSFLGKEVTQEDIDAILKL